MDYQITLLCRSGKYKPVSAIVSAEVGTDRQTIITKGVQKICAKRMWGKSDLTRYEYTKCKVREYDKAKIETENKAHYEAIKEQKYASGEWKRPKKRVDKTTSA